MSANSSNKLIIFDTTLRDGEQSPGASMTKDEKIRIARQLERLKVDIIEAGFAAPSARCREQMTRISLVQQRLWRRLQENAFTPLSRRLHYIWRRSCA
jgi:isopropylmalate/homocitrate/citramalate synthase